MSDETRQRDGYIDRGFDEDRGQEAQFNTLEYRPDLSIEERERTAWELSENTGETSPVSPERPIGDGAIVDIIEEIKNLDSVIRDKLKEIINNQGRKPIFFYANQEADVKRAKEELGLNPDEDFSFNDYVVALENRETAAGDYLIEVSERYFEGIDGNLEMELYQDYFETKEELDLLQTYMMRTVDSILSDEPIDLSSEEWGELLYKKEQEWSANKNLQLATKIKRDELYKEAFLFNQGQLERQKELRYREKKDIDKVVAEANQLTNTLKIVEHKTQDLRQIVRHMEIIEEDRLKEEEQERMTQDLMMSVEDGQLTDDLTHVGLLLTLTVDDYNSQKHHYKHSLRDIYSLSNKNKLMDELSVYQNVYRNNVLPLSHNLKLYRLDPEYGTRNLLENLTKSMLNTTQQQKQRLIDWENIQSATSELRKKKLNEVSQKEDARQEYQLFKQIKEKGAVE